MQTRLFFSAIFFSLLFNACSFSKGIKKDLNTGLSSSYNGFALEDIYFTDANSNRLSNNQIPLGSKLAIVATGVDYFKEADGKVFPGCRILLTDKAGKEILNLPDAFASLSGGTTSAEAKTLEASLNTGEPMVAGETYHLNVRFFDKKNATNEIVSDIDLVMKQ